MKEFKSKRLRVWENINRTMQEFKVLLLGYRSYTALLTQSGTNAPVATVLENTLGGEVVWSRESEGTYITNLTIFDVAKTFVYLTPNTDFTDKPIFAIDSFENKVRIYTVDDGDYSDGMLVDTPIEIRVYN